MAELDDLKERIEEAIHANGTGEITGSVLQETLLDMVDTISENSSGGSDVSVEEGTLRIRKS